MLQIVAETLLCGLMLRTSVFNGVIVHYRVPQLSWSSSRSPLLSIRGPQATHPKITL